MTTTLKNALEQVSDRVRHGECPNEASVSSGCVLPILQALDWPVFDTKIVAPEYSAGSGRVDFALRSDKNTADVFIEVKAVGKPGGEAQLFQYAFEQGVPILILTNGEEWSFYHALGQGTYDERRFYKLNLLERDHEVSSDIFNRYLNFHAVRSGEAKRSAQKDCDTVRNRRVAKKYISEAWKSLLDSAEPTLHELIADTVEDLCGHSPSADDVQYFLQEQAKLSTKNISGSQANQRSFVKSDRNETPYGKTPQIQRSRYSTNPNSELGYAFSGKWVSCRNAREVASSTIEELIRRDPNWASRFMSREHGRSRRYLATDVFDLYPGRPDLATHSIEVAPGLWLGTNYNRKSFEQIIKLAVEVAGLKWGTDYHAVF